MTVRSVSRTTFDGTTLSITFGRHTVPCISASYGDKVDPQHLSAMGSQQIDEVTEGGYSTERGSIKMTAKTFRSIVAPLMQERGFGSERIGVVATFYHPDTGDDSDYLEGCRIIGLKQALENSNSATTVELELDYCQIYWTNDRITINKLDTSEPLYSSNF